MTAATLKIDLSALTQNWLALNAMSGAETGAVVKANAYGLGAAKVSQALAAVGARCFFVALASEGETIRTAIGPDAHIMVFGGHMEGDAELLEAHKLTPILNSVDQMIRHFERLPNHPFGVQLDSGMNRLGLEPAEWAAIKDIAMSKNPDFIMSHLSCADDPSHPMNEWQLNNFCAMTDDLRVDRSLAATGGILLGSDYHFNLTRPGIGIYGGLPYRDAQPVVQLEAKVIQFREVAANETVGYGNSWVASGPCRIATVAIGYADGVLRSLSSNGNFYFEKTPCPIVGRVSMDLVTVDISNLEIIPETLSLLCNEQTIDDVAAMAGTIGYEILTAFGSRYERLIAT